MKKIICLAMMAEHLSACARQSGTVRMLNPRLG